MTAVNLNNLLSSYDNLNNFMKGEKTISYLKSIGDSKKRLKIEPFSNSNKIVIIAKLYLSIIKDIFLGIISKPFYPSKTSIHFHKVNVSLQKIGLFNKFGKKLLMPGINRVSPKYINSSFDMTKIDRNVKKSLIRNDKNKDIKIISPANFSNGICRGMCNWFTFLYNNTLESFKNKSTEYHLKAIASLFKDGAPIEGFLSHLHPNINGIIESIFPYSQNTHIFASPLDEKKVKIYLKKIPLGLYHVSYSKHVINVIKASNDSTYIWDPNNGLIKIKGSFEDAFFYYFEKAGLKNKIKQGFVLFSLQKDLQPNMAAKVKKVSSEIFILKKSKKIESIYEYVLKNPSLRKKIEFLDILTRNFLKLFNSGNRRESIKEIFSKAYKKSDYNEIFYKNFSRYKKALALGYKTIASENSQILKAAKKKI